MTWTSHTLTNAAVALALTGRPALAAGAMLTAALPDKLEGWLPFAKHRGLSHWLVWWAAGLMLVASLARAHRVGFGGPWWPTRPDILLWEALLGLALGPLLHVVLDGFSAAGVPLGLPFGPARLRLGLYRTCDTRRFSLDISEAVFVSALLVLCAVAWRALWMR